jgi:hypothetical protein
MNYVVEILWGSFLDRRIDCCIKRKMHKMLHLVELQINQFFWYENITNV